ncbi:MAG: hypothetical protein GWP10_20475 [Nitrospiraceae bacterium]|nr:hypothetical protein [Nitrospiraceae bacterium]
MTDKLHLPIIDPLGILGRPAAKLIKNLIGEDVELRDPVRDLVMDMFIEDDDEVVGREEKEKTGGERESYLNFGKRVITFSCSRCQGIAEQVAAKYAPDSPKKQLECMYYIKMFDENDVGDEGYEEAKSWLEKNGLKDVLYEAYLTELGVNE